MNTFAELPFLIVLKRTLLILLIAGSIGFVAYVFFTFKRNQFHSADPLSVIPSSVSVLMECKISADWQPYKEWMRGLATEGRYVAGVPFNPLVQWPDVLDRLDNLWLNDLSWGEVLKNSSVVFASPAQGRGDQWAMAVGLDDAFGSAHAAGLIEKMYQGMSFVPRSFNGTEIYESAEIRYSFVQQCIVVSSSSAFIEEIIQCNSDRSVLSQSNFIEAKRTASADIPLHFYFSWKKGSWITLDPQFSNERKLLSGYIVYSDSLFEAHEDEISSFSVAGILPASVVMLDEKSVRHFDDAWKNLDRAAMNTDEGIFWSRAWSDIGDSCNCDLNESVLSWQGGEWGAFVTEANDSSTNEYLFFSVRDSMNAMNFLQPLLADSTAEKIKRIVYPKVFDRNRYSSVLVSAEYAVQLGNYVFLSDDPDALMRLELSANSGNTLAQTSDYKLAAGVLNSSGGRLFFQRENMISLFPPAMVNAFSGSFFAANLLPFNSRKQMLNVTLPDGDFKARTSETTIPVNEDVLWKCPLQAPLRKGPWIVVNHNTNDSEVVVQDENNTIYLISTDGKVLWKKDLPGPLLSDVKQIDLLKNNKFQLVFNTSAMVYCLDRNGRDVNGFPIALPQPATGSMAVFDYDSNRTYRLLVPGSRGQIFNFNTEGKRTEGWDYKPAGEDILVLDHMRIAEEDFILVIGENGKTDLLKRNGQLRFSPKTKADGFANHGFVIIPGHSIEESRILYPDNTGKIIELTFGKGSRSNGLTGLSEGAHVSFADINNDRNEDYFIADGSTLRIFDSSREKISEVTVDGNIRFEPLVYKYSSGEYKIGITTDANKFYLLSTDGSIMPGYPKEAYSRAKMTDLNNDRKKDFVVGLGTFVIAYK